MNDIIRGEYNGAGEPLHIKTDAIQPSVLVVTGGSIELEFVREYLKTHSFQTVIAVDKGLETTDALGIVPKYLVGDFDTVDSKVLAAYRNRADVIVREFMPEKDLTDTQIALSLACEIGAKRIVLLGATGNRFDHMLANVFLLEELLKSGVSCEILDAHNRIYLTDKSFTLSKREMFGEFLSLIPLSDVVENVTLTGMKYPLHQATMYRKISGLGVSNEVVNEKACVEFSSGVFIVVEARD